MAVVAKPPPSQHVTNVESRWIFPQSDSKDWPCGIQDQIWAFNAATGNALTTVLAGFAFTTVSLPNIILLVALVASESARAPLVMAFAAAAFIPRGAMVIALRVSLQGHLWSWPLPQLLSFP